ncbi:hypothetical protein BDY21DRAFT_359292 [Lineolata rhizophorae]|uniref:Uncharacterized protein n=1 Tax=Lineolata rhizophorae TaxID=578093 RepID=A0A6A6NMB1_9PEZI|nr:hypothetical protein BDY21DRAFT_359292 [Lineolata rhizophorae]
MVCTPQTDGPAETDSSSRRSHVEPEPPAAGFLSRDTLVPDCLRRRPHRELRRLLRPEAARHRALPGAVPVDAGGDVSLDHRALPAAAHPGQGPLRGAPLRHGRVDRDIVRAPAADGLRVADGPLPAGLLERDVSGHGRRHRHGRHVLHRRRRDGVQPQPLRVLRSPRLHRRGTGGGGTQV